MVPEKAESFLRSFHTFLQRGDGVLIGVDLRKDPTMLEAAYNDAKGVTAEFNLNVLRRLNRDLHADFDVGAFAHEARFSDEKSRVEMHLRSLESQTVRIGDRTFSFAQGETIHTENSCKYSIEGFQSLARRAAFEPIRVWTDPDGLFSDHYLEIRDS